MRAMLAGAAARLPAVFLFAYFRYLADAVPAVQG